MRGLKVLARVVAGAAGVVAAGVATNQVLNNGALSWNWAYAAFALALIAELSRELLVSPPSPVTGARPPRGSLGVYLRQVRASVSYMETLGVATQSEFMLRTRQVYVDVSLMPKPTHDTAREPYVGAVPARPQAVPGERRTLESFLAAGHDGGRVLAVIGGPGSGKTTLVRTTTLNLSTCTWRFWRGGPLPVLLYLRDHAGALMAAQPPGLAAVATSAGWLAGRIPAAWLERRLDRGGCVVLLDGLDEVADEDDRVRVVAWIRRQIERHPRNQYVVTSRPHGYLSNPLPSAEVLQVRRFTHEQIGRYLHGWYHAIESRAADAPGPAVREIAAGKADDLLARLRAAPGLYDLAANPLLLTMIANVHRYRGQLPGGRAALYAEMCDVLLHRRQEARNLTDATGLRGPQKERVVRHLALAMMRGGVRDMAAMDAGRAIRRALRQVSGTVTPEVFLEEARKSGLLVEREHGRYAFAHLTLQEYLAAAQIGQHDPGPLAGHVDDPWWRETILLWSANADATPVIEACLASGTVRALALAFDCAEQALQVDPGVRERLEALLDVGDAEQDQDRRRLLAGVKAARSLREVIWLDENTAVCARPVSRDLYDMFLRDTGVHGDTWYGARGRAPSGDAPPSGGGDAPSGGRRDVPSAARGNAPPEAAEEEPVVGVLAGHAHVFVGWLNALLDGDLTYRLPTREEMGDPALSLVEGVSGHTVWVRDPGDTGAPGAPEPSEVTATADDIVLHQPDGVPSPYAPDVSRLVDYPARDVAFCGDHLALVLGAEPSPEAWSYARVFAAALEYVEAPSPGADRDAFARVLVLASHLELQRLADLVLQRASHVRRAVVLVRVMRLGQALGVDFASHAGLAGFLTLQELVEEKLLYGAFLASSELSSLVPALARLAPLHARIDGTLGHLDRRWLDYSESSWRDSLVPDLEEAVRHAAGLAHAGRPGLMSGGPAMVFNRAGALGRLSGLAGDPAHRPDGLLDYCDGADTSDRDHDLRRAVGLALVMHDDRFEGTMIALRALLDLWRPLWGVDPITQKVQVDRPPTLDRVLADFTSDLSFTLGHRGNPVAALREGIAVLSASSSTGRSRTRREQALRLAAEAEALIAPVMLGGASYNVIDFACARVRLIAAVAVLVRSVGGQFETPVVYERRAAERLAEAMAGLAGLQDRFEGRLPANELIVLVRS
ncbi:NACHT domain-containing protein [Sphaerisporangium rhizosphaerae]|uniref:NACHT domain-containing protein n=1 Tax=Sphaerisporangium rhizosphaerae TaxID=2269375 RepID=A0ABW2P146_9ACTN